MQTNQEYTKPFLKWAGNKFRIINIVISNIKKYNNCNRTDYIEPFGGAGSILINLEGIFSKRTYADYNKDLVDLFRHIQKDKETLIDEIGSIFTPENNKETQYYKLRKEFNSLKGESNSIRKSAIFVYLNRHCFNGLCRYGPNGFNVPFGRYKSISAPLSEIHKVSEKISKNVKIVSGDFEKNIREAGCNSIVYCDPPYFPLSITSSFTKYSGGEDFGIDSQNRLALAAKEAAERGAIVLISNHNTVECRKLYSSMQNKDVQVDLSVTFDVPRFISAKGEGRGKCSPELIAVFKPKKL